MDYLPTDREQEYENEAPGSQMTSLVPSGEQPSKFIDKLATKFKSVSAWIVILCFLF